MHHRIEMKSILVCLRVAERQYGPLPQATAFLLKLLFGISITGQDYPYTSSPRFANGYGSRRGLPTRPQPSWPLLKFVPEASAAR
jgi:hypothetical protein